MHQSFSLLTFTKQHDYDVNVCLSNRNDQRMCRPYSPYSNKNAHNKIKIINSGTFKKYINPDKHSKLYKRLYITTQYI